MSCDEAAIQVGSGVSWRGLEAAAVRHCTYIPMYDALQLIFNIFSTKVADTA